jgi:hypothetical protein
MPEHIRIPVSALRAGDILTPTNREVVRCSRGISTPSGCHDVDLRSAEPEGDPEGHGWTRSTFRSRTMVTVLRNTGAAGLSPRAQESAYERARHRRAQRARRRMGMGGQYR